MKKIILSCLIACVCAAGFGVANAKTSEVSVTAASTAKANMSRGTWLVVSGQGVRIRTAPSLNSKVVGHANESDSFYCDYTYRNGFYRIKYKGKWRWISGDFVWFPEG